jgi:hypothetical protein
LKQSFKRALALVLLIATPLFTPDFASAQDKTTLTRKVVFPKGRTTAVLKASIKKGTNHHYLLRARAGQTMTVHLAAKQCGFTVYKPDGGEAIEEADGVTDWSGALPESGEYTIEVATDARLTPYTLEVTIR